MSMQQQSKSKKRKVKEEADSDEEEEETEWKVDDEEDDDEDDDGEEEEEEEGDEKSPIMKNEEGDAFIELSAKRRCTIRKFKSSVLIDIREVRNQHGTVYYLLNHLAHSCVCDVTPL
jgi:Transcriptional Coactivator p15 (PC4)